MSEKLEKLQALLAEAARGRLVVQGYEAYGPATAVLEIEEQIPRQAPAQAAIGH